MGMVKMKSSDIKLSREYLEQQAAARKDRQIDFSDIPQYTSEQLDEMRRQAILRRQVAAKRKRKMFSLRLQSDVIEWWQSFGDGYTNIMTRLLEEAWKHPEWIEECLKPTHGRIPVLPLEPRY
jgi:uncharacterized protein (DUF4415 family)